MKAHGDAGRDIFTRGWTLQELLAPATVELYSKEGDFLATKETLVMQIHENTSIPFEALRGTPLSQFRIDEKIGWTEARQTKKKEDQAYCLLGMFGVFMPLIYGEGSHALERLRQEIDKKHGTDVAVRLVARERTENNGIHNRQHALDKQELHSFSYSGPGDQNNIWGFNYGDQLRKLDQTVTG